jgi:hypothetical protein
LYIPIVIYYNHLFLFKEGEMNVKHLLLVVLLLSLLFTLYSCDGSSGPSSGKRQWTIIGYFDGNNDLDYGQLQTSWVIEELQALEEIGSTDEVEILALLACLKKGGIAKIYHVDKIDNELPDTISSPVLDDWGTKDMSDSKTLKDFIVWCKENYPAENYMLIIMDHGAGWMGACVDEKNGAGNLMTMPAMRQAIEDGGVHFDVIFFAACLMGQAEVMYELNGLCDYVAASQNIMYANAAITPNWLADLTEDPSLSGLDVSKRIVDGVYDAGESIDMPVTMAVFDMNHVVDVASAIGTFGNNLASYGLQHLQGIVNAHASAYQDKYDLASFMDLREFAKSISQDPDLSEIALVKDSASALVSSLNNLIPYTKSNVQEPRSGMTIYFPLQQYDNAYEDLKFTGTNWHNFIKQFIEENPDPGEGITISGTVTYPGHVLSSNCVAFADTSHSEYIIPMVVTSVDPGTGAYTLQINTQTNIEAYIEAWDNVNGDSVIDNGEGFGWFDYDGEGDWDDMLVWEVGKSYTGVNIVLTPWGGKSRDRDPLVRH